MDQEYLKNKVNNLIGRRISIRIFDTVFSNEELTGTVVRLLRNASPLLIHSMEILLTNTFMVKLDSPVEYEDSILVSKSDRKRILNYVIIVVWDSKELLSLIEGDSGIETTSMHLYVLKNGISPEEKDLEMEDMYGISNEVEVRLL